MSLPEILATPATFITDVVIGPVLTFNKSNFGAYVSANVDLDRPISASFLFSNRNNGLTDWTVKISEKRNVSNTAGYFDRKVEDTEMSVWIKAVAPMGQASFGGFTQSEVAARIRQLCALLLTGDTIDRMVRGEL